MSWLSILPKELLLLLQAYLSNYKMIIEIDDFHNCRSNYSGCCLKLRMSKVIFEKSPNPFVDQKKYIFENVYLYYTYLEDFIDFHNEHKNYIDTRTNQYLDHPIKSNALDFYTWGLVYSDNLFELLMFDYKCGPGEVTCENKKIIEHIKFDRESSNEIWRQLLEIKKSFEYIIFLSRLSAC